MEPKPLECASVGVIPVLLVARQGEIGLDVGPALLLKGEAKGALAEGVHRTGSGCALLCRGPVSDVAPVLARHHKKMYARRRRPVVKRDELCIFKDNVEAFLLGHGTEHTRPGASREQAPQ